VASIVERAPVVGMLVRLDEVRGARDPQQLAREAGLVVVDRDAQRLHRLEDFDLEGPDLDLGRLAPSAARAVEGVLLAIDHQRHPAV
jgi:hypothetical protein